MARAKLTLWFVDGQVPVRPGVYNVSCRKSKQTGKWWARWDGKQWFFADDIDIDSVARETITCGNFWHATGSWRGLANKPRSV